MRDYVKNNGIDEENILPVLAQVTEEVAAAKEEVDKKQPSWIDKNNYINDENITLSNGAVVKAIVIPPYTVVNKYYINGSDPVHIAFANLDREVSLLPFPEMEYYLPEVILDHFIWPAQADLPWPDGINPKELSVYYYVYIQNGRVLSCGPQLSYCSSTYYVDIPESAVGQTFKLEHSSTSGQFVKVLIDGVEASTKSSFSTPGLHSVTTFYHFDFVLAIDEMPICQFITSIDLSQHNPSAPIRLSGFNCSSIIWPTNFALRPVNYLSYNLNVDSLDLSNFRFLSLTSVGELSFVDGYIGRIEGEIFLPSPTSINSYRGTIAFIRNTSPNTVLRQLVNAAALRGWMIHRDGFSECYTLEQAGSVNMPWLCDSGAIFKSCTALKFANVMPNNMYVFDFRYFQKCSNLKEVIISSPPDDYVSVSSEYYGSNTLLRLDTLVFNGQVKNFYEDVFRSTVFDSEHPTNVYIPMGWDSVITERLQEIMPASWTLYRYESLDEIPFQYAPLD